MEWPRYTATSAGNTGYNNMRGLARVMDFAEGVGMSGQSLPETWIRLAWSCEQVTKTMDVNDHVRIRSEARAQAYIDCATDLEARDGRI